MMPPATLEENRFRDPNASVVAVNMSPQPQTITVDLTGTGIEGTKVHTLAASEPSLQSVSTLVSVTLPPFASWVASLQ